MMILKDEAMFMRKSGGASPVMDGLIHWTDSSSFDIDNLLIYDSINSEYIECTFPEGRFFSNPDIENDNNCIRITPSGNKTMVTPKKYSGVYTLEMVAGADRSEKHVAISTNNRLNNAFGIYAGQASGAANRIVSLWTGEYYWNGFGVDMPEGKLHHIVATFGNNSIATLYVDGVNCGTTNYRNIDKAVFMPLMVGCWTENVYSTHVYWGCSRLYNRPLTEDEALLNYNYEKSIGRFD